MPPRLTRRQMLACFYASVVGACRWPLESAGVSGTPGKLVSETPLGSVWLFETAQQPSVDVLLVYPGGEWANPYREGLAHYVEHLAWRSVGSSRAQDNRHSNAWTSAAATAYMLSDNAASLSVAVQRVIDSAGPLQVSSEYAARERDIVLREYDQRLGENVLDTIWVDTSKRLYGASPLARSVMGSRADISTFDLPAATQLHDQSHHIDQATLMVRGPVSAGELGDAIANVKHWPLPRTGALPAPDLSWPAHHETNIASRQVQVQVQGLGADVLLIRQAFREVPGFTVAEADAARVILAHLLSSTKRGSIVRPLKYERFLANTIEVHINPLSTVGLELSLQVYADAGVSLKHLNEEVTDVLHRALTLPDSDSFNDIRDRELAHVKGILQPLAHNYTRLHYALMQGRPFVSVSSRQRAIENLTFARFSEFSQYLSSPQSSVTRLLSSV